VTDLHRFTFLRKGSSSAHCEADDCRWCFTRPSAAATVAAKAREHSRKEGHETRVYDTRVTVYRPAEG
jgi:hypothetical protein